MAQRPAICPRCGTLIGSEESRCSQCGTSRSALLWRIFSLARGADGDLILKSIITLNVVYYVISLALNVRTGSGGFYAPGDLSLLFLGATGTVPIDQFGNFWTLLSANYLHGGILHLLFNLMALHRIGPLAVNEYGAKRMFVIYTIGGVFGFWISYLAGVPFTIGASAGICSLIGALLYFGKTRGGVYGGSVYREVSGWALGLLVFGLIVPGINNWGHGGGIVGGIALGMLLGYGERRRETALHTNLALLCGVATVSVLLWRATLAVLSF